MEFLSDAEEYLPYALFAIGAVILASIVIWIMLLRVIVPPNVVHIVQRSKSTTSYGSGHSAGNTYYEFPGWLPIIGVTVLQLPVSNFDISLTAYEAYDKDRLPFLVDVKAFFRIGNTNAAAQKVASFEELHDQLTSIVQGAVRSILAKSELDKIMSERSTYGEQFTHDVGGQLTQWGVEPVKNIELMDVRDARDSRVIENIMAKKKSEIEKDSRKTVAENIKLAQQAEIDADQQVKVKKADADRIVGTQQAESDKSVGISREQSHQAIQEEARITAEKLMSVKQVNIVRQAEIEKESAIVAAEQQKAQIQISADANKYQTSINADAHKYQTTVNADAEKYRIEQTSVAKLTEKQNEAKGILAVGQSSAEAEKLNQLASVTAQTTLAKEVGENKQYQDYLVRIKEVEASIAVGVEQAKNIGHAEIKIIANAGDIQGGVKSVGEVFTPKGGTNVAGMIEALKQTEGGKELVDSFFAMMKKKD
ncbi:MAG: hypothetical protein LBC09_05905 [Helicobacteraceae bacterium]|jgi:flotillin|nr:hypothetical protein [Helicobacteraceae bacterium]